MSIATSMLHRGLRGAVGDLIFRNYNGKTVVSLRPVYKNETNTEARRMSRSRFREATHFAQNAMLNVKQKAYYQQKARQLKLPNAYTAAITDFLRKAKASVATRSSFAARKGDVLKIKLSKSVFKVNSLRVAACNTRGDQLAAHTLTTPGTSGVFSLVLESDWHDLRELKISSDEPGNKTYTVTPSQFIQAARLL